MSVQFTCSSGNLNGDSNANVPSRVVLSDASDQIQSAKQTVAPGGVRQDGGATTGNGCGSVRCPNAYTALHTLKATEGVITEDSTSASYAVTLPAASSSLGQEYRITNIGTTNSIALTGAGSDSIQANGGSLAATYAIAAVTTVSVFCLLNHAGTPTWFAK